MRNRLASRVRVGESSIAVSWLCDMMSGMPTTLEKLETLFLRLRGLPEARQELAVEALSEIAGDVYALSDDERAALEPALRDAERNENLADAETDEILSQAWR